MGAAAAAVDTRPRPGPAPCGVRSGDGQAQRRPAPHWIAAAGTRSGSDSSWRAAMPDATRAQPAAHRQLVGLLRSRGASALHCKMWLAAAARGAAAGHAQAASRTRPQRSCGQIDVGPGGQAPRAPMGAGFGAAPLTPSTAPSNTKRAHRSGQRRTHFGCCRALLGRGDRCSRSGARSSLTCAPARSAMCEHATLGAWRDHRHRARRTPGRFWRAATCPFPVTLLCVCPAGARTHCCARRVHGALSKHSVACPDAELTRCVVRLSVPHCKGGKLCLSQRRLNCPGPRLNPF